MRKQTPKSVGISRVLNLSRSVSLGLTVSLGLILFTFFGRFFDLASPKTLHVSFLFLGVISIPIILSLSEVSGGRRSDGNNYFWTDATHHPVATFMGGWILVAGFISLIALLAIGAAISTQKIISLFWSIEVPLSWIGLGVLALGMLSNQQFHYRRSLAGLSFIGAALIVAIIGDGVFYGDFSMGISGHIGSSQEFIRVAIRLSVFLWFIPVLLMNRERIVRPSYTVPVSLLLVMLVTVLLGTGAAIISSSLTSAAQFDGFFLLFRLGTLPKLYEMSVAVGFWSIGAILCLVALHYSVVCSARVVGRLLLVGTGENKEQAPGKLLFTVNFIIFSLAGISLLLMPLSHLITITAIGFYWSTAAILLPIVFKKSPHLQSERKFKLPYHPLVPGMALSIALLLPLRLESGPLFIVLTWMLLGVLIYLIMFRKQKWGHTTEFAIAGESPLLETISPETNVVLTVLSGAMDETDQSLLEGACQLAAKRDAQLMVLNIINLPEAFPQYELKKQTNHALSVLKELVSRTALPEGVPLIPLIRVSSSFLEALLTIVTESGSDLLILGQDSSLHEDLRQKTVLNRLIRTSPCDVAMISGILPAAPKHILIPNDGRGNVNSIFSLAESLGDNTHTTILSYSQDGMDNYHKWEEDYSGLVSVAANPERLQQKIIRGRSVENRILHESKKADLMVMSLPQGGVMNLPYVGGLPMRVALQLHIPSVLLRLLPKGKIGFFKQKWGSIFDMFPVLDTDERRSLIGSMRKSAEPTIDYFVLIILSSAIASLGLLQNSAAVIIGAMLVAPLMSPILAMAMAIVQGDMKMLRRAAESVSKGVAVAVGVSAFTVILSPIEEPTPEIFARVAPTVLDLFIALVSGAAAGYAMSRRNVSAALPGVAISAALVPPVCVIGYGIGAAQFGMAMGSFMLFVTNLVAIIFSAALVFMMLGMTPKKGDRKFLVRNLRNAMVALVAVTLILGVMTYRSVGNQNRRLRVDRLFEEGLLERSTLLNDYTIEEKDGKFIVKGTLLSFEGKEKIPPQGKALQERLEKALGGPVTLDVTMVSAENRQFSLESLGHIRNIRTRFFDIIIGYPVEVDSILVFPVEKGFQLNARLLVTENGMVGEAEVAALQERLSREEGLPVTLNIVLINGSRIQTKP